WVDLVGQGLLVISGAHRERPAEVSCLRSTREPRALGRSCVSWQRLGCGGVLTFQESADAVRVLAQGEHVLHRARLSLLLQGLPPGFAAPRLEKHVQALLCAAGLPEQPCRVLASPRPDCALVQLPTQLSEAEVGVLEEEARVLGLDGAVVTLARMPQARAVRVVGGTPAPDPLLLELYLENEPRSGGGPLEDLRSLPGALGIIVSFQQWQAAERVLQRDHWLQDSKLHLIPHYDILEPQELAKDTCERDCLAQLCPEASEHTLLEAGGPTRVLEGQGALTMTDPVEAPGQSETTLRLGPVELLGQEGPLSQGLVGSPGQEEPMSLGPVGSVEQEGPVSLGSVGCLEREGPVGLGPVGSLEQEGPVHLEPVGFPGQEGPVGLGPAGSLEQEGRVGSPEPRGAVETVLSMEPGALRFLQLHHQDLLASLGDVALFPLEGMDVTGFRLCGALAPCQAAEEFLRSLLSSISCYVLSLRHPGSASFLLGPEGQCLLRGLEAQFQCVFGTERLARAALDIGPEEVQVESCPTLPLPTPGSSRGVSLEEVRELLATLEGLDGEEWLPLELGEEEPEKEPPQEKEEAVSLGCSVEEPVAPNPGTLGRLEEEAALQLALHRSLEPRDSVVEREEAAALQQALALSLLEQPLLEAEEPPGSGAGGPAQLVVHSAFEQDMEELDRALEAALEAHLREETVDSRGRVLSAELCAQLEKCHGVSIGLHEDYAVLRGFGAQPARAARHFAALLACPWDQSEVFPLAASGPSGQRLQPRLEGPLPTGGLECLAESSEGVPGRWCRPFYDTLDAAHSRIRIVPVERVSHPLLQRQYELHRERLEQRCEQRPVEQVLYHGTSAPAVPDICAHGFNRSFCGRNGTLFGQGVYFAKRASLSVQDRYSPPNADGHKAVFVARVLTGDYGQGHRGLRAPPPRASGHHLLRYDSAVDNLRLPSIFVIFHDTQALPTHLITCKRTHQASA
uniref:Poly [ADP-ribose] polymerase n=1 Tax=Loxodonta africana TaxID=9785 RepID=G3STT2_LOXAF